MSTRPFVTQVYSNLKSPRPLGDAWSLEVGRHTLLVGSNASNKSSIIQAVELGLSGAADDIVGRSAVRDAAMLLTLAPGDELGVTLHLSDESVCTFNVQQKDGQAKKPQHLGAGSDTLVHRAVSEALAGSSTTARKAFLAWAGTSVTMEDVLAHIPAELHAKYRDLAEHKGRDKSVVDTLLDIASYAGKIQREATKEAKGAEIVLEDMGDKVEDRPSDEDVRRLYAAVAEARKVLDDSIYTAGVGLSRTAHAHKMTTLMNDLREQETKLAQLEKEGEEKLPRCPSRGQHEDGAVEVLWFAVGKEMDTCPACSTQVGKAHLSNCLQFYLDRSDSADAVQKQRDEAQSHLYDLVGPIEDRISVLKYKIYELEQVPIVDEAAPTLPVADAQSRLEAATAALASTEAVVADWDKLARVRDVVFEMHKKASVYKDLKKHCESAIGRLLDERTADFCGRVKKYLPDTWDFSIELLDGDREVFRMGLMRDGVLHSSPSGAEWAAVKVAISMAVAEGIPNNQPAILIPDDRAWDGKTLSAVMRGFLKFDGQVLMASTIRPTGRTPKGWTVINMDEVREEWVSLGAAEPDEDEVEEPESEEVSPTSKNASAGGLVVTTRSALMLEEMGFEAGDVKAMSRDTVAAIIRDGLSPEVVQVNDDGTYTVVRGSNVLPLPPTLQN